MQILRACVKSPCSCVVTKPLLMTVIMHQVEHSNFINIKIECNDVKLIWWHCILIRSSDSPCGIPTWEIYTKLRSRRHRPDVSNASHLPKRLKKTETQSTSFLQDEEVIDMECGVDEPNIRHPLANKLGQDSMKTIHHFLSISVAKMSIDNTCPQSQQKRLGTDHLHEANGNASHPGMPNSMPCNITGADY